MTRYGLGGIKSLYNTILYIFFDKRDKDSQVMIYLYYCCFFEGVAFLACRQNLVLHF